MKALLALAAAAFLLAGCAAFNVVTHSVSTDPVKVTAGTYHLDPDHWSLTFSVDHFGFSRYVARFDAMEATLTAVPDAPEKSRVAVTIKTASLDTRNPELDKTLTGTEFFDAGRYPDITFTVVSLTRKGVVDGKETGEMTGALTMHGQTHPVTLDVTFNGAAPNPLTGVETLGFSARGSFDRSLWGLSSWWPAVGNEVRVAIEAEFVKSAR
jgi:polyisoprenoid-binding protein YceI